MKRRDFIKGFFATLVAAQVVQLPGPASTPLGGLSDWQKGSIIAEALKTKAGRDALAQSMTQPLKRRLNYQAIGRSAFVVEPLPQGALPIYDNDFNPTAYVTGERDIHSINDPEFNEALRQLYSQVGSTKDGGAVDKIVDLPPLKPKVIGPIRRALRALSRLFG